MGFGVTGTCILVTVQKCYNHLEKCLKVSYKIKTVPTHDPAFPIRSIYPRQMRTCVHKILAQECSWWLYS